MLPNFHTQSHRTFFTGTATAAQSADTFARLTLTQEQKTPTLSLDTIDHPTRAMKKCTRYEFSPNKPPNLQLYPLLYSPY